MSSSGDERWLPYQVFFPMGVLLGLMGVSYWPLYAFHVISSIPSVPHMDIQIHGFLFSFVLGFLMTALPRFSSTPAASTWEIASAFLILLTGNLLTVAGQIEAGRFLFLGNVALLIRFASVRFHKRKANPPEEFVFVAAGILLGLTGAILRSVSMLGMAWLETPGRRLLTEGMMMSFVIGIGGKLAPLFFGFERFLLVPSIAAQPRVTRRQLLLAALALVFVLSFVVEYTLSTGLALWIRALVATVLFAWVFRLYRVPRGGGVIAWMLWISLWWAFLSTWGAVSHPQYRTPVLHVLFIGGFGVLILCIGSRVILSHGNYPMEIERKSIALLSGSLLILTAMVLRVISDLFPERYFLLLGLAGCLWMVGLFIWGSVFARRALAQPRAPGAAS